jgi:hypothetical protein
MMEEEGRRKRVVSFVDANNEFKRKRAVKIMNQEAHQYTMYHSKTENLENGSIQIEG